jgi:putative chitinase
MTNLQVKAVTCSAAENTELFLPYLEDVIIRYDINTPVRQLCFLSQISHESGGLFYTEELASGAAYEGRKDLGNIHPGDGERFKGRGLIQITGRTNYGLLGQEFGIDLINHPELLGGRNVHTCSVTQLKNAALSAGWFWKRANLNRFADLITLDQPVDEGSNLDHFKEITKHINGGYNGLADRLHRYKEGVQLFKFSLQTT